MDQLRFAGLYEDGQHAVLTAADGSEFLVAIDDRLRAAVRRPSPSNGGRTTPATPREVQTQIRAGASAEEVAESTGWTVERIERYEGPILAEREYVAGLARSALIRTHERSEAPPTLESRARERLNKRGVDLGQVSWDSIRPTGGGWSVQLHFKAGQRARSASWSFDPDTRSVDAIDDEARWLSEDEQSLPTGSAATALLGGSSDAPDDLTSALRERSKRRGASGRRRKSAAARGAREARGMEESRGSEHMHEGAEDAEDDGQHDLPHDSHAVGPRTVAGAATAAPEPDGGSTTDDLEASRGLGAQAAREDDRDGHSGQDVDAETAGDSALAEQEEREATLADFFGSDADDDQADDIRTVDGEDGQLGIDEESQVGPEGDGPQVDEAEDGADREGGDNDDSPGPDEGDAQWDGVNSPDLQAADDPQTPDSPGRDEKPDKGSPRGRKGRTSVPSWDDIMFGAKDRGR